MRNPRLRTARVALESSGLVETGDVVGCRPARRACPRSHRAVQALGPFGASSRSSPPARRDVRDAKPRGAPRWAFERPVGAAPSGRPGGAEGSHSPVRARASAMRRAATHHVTRFMKPRQFKANERRLDARVAQLVGVRWVAQLVGARPRTNAPCVVPVRFHRPSGVRRGAFVGQRSRGGRLPRNRSSHRRPR